MYYIFYSERIAFLHTEILDARFFPVSFKASFDVSSNLLRVRGTLSLRLSLTSLLLFCRAEGTFRVSTKVSWHQCKS
jgi:hypothetical protein